MELNMDSVILFSGGLDSYIGYHYLNKPQPIYFNINSRYSLSELQHIQIHLNHMDIIIDQTLSFLGTYEIGINAYIPFRNLFLAITAALKYSKHIYICGLKDDNVSDKNKEIFKLWSDTLSKTSNDTVIIDSPFWEMTKADIVQWYSEHHNKNDLLTNTYSCYESGLDHCYCCPACFRRNVALYTVGIDLPFYNKELLTSYKENNNNYDKQRANNMLKYINDKL